MKRVDLSAVNSVGETPLHLASSNGRIDCVKTLIKNRVDLNICNKHGETPLHYATRSGNLEVVRYLLDNGADYSVLGENGTPKTIAQLANREDIAALFPSTNLLGHRFNSAANLDSNKVNEILLQLQSKYEEEMERRKRAIQALDLLKEALRSEVDSHSKTKLELEQMKSKLDDEKSKRIPESSSPEIAAARESERELSIMRSELEKARIKYKEEELLRTKLETMLKDMNSDFAKSGTPLTRVDETKRTETHESISKELRTLVALSKYRDWETGWTYTSPELMKLMNINESDLAKRESLIAEWHVNKIKEIQSRFAPYSGEEIPLSENRTFTKSGPLLLMPQNPNETAQSCFVILLSDLFIVTNVDDEGQYYLVLVFSLDQFQVQETSDNPNVFELQSKDGKRKFLFIAGQAKDKTNWVNSLQLACAGVPKVSEEKSAKKSTSKKNLIPLLRQASIVIRNKDEVPSIIKSIEMNDPLLKSVNLAKSAIRGRLMTTLMSALNTNHHVTTLILSNNGLEDKGVVGLCSGLRGIPLTSLHLDSNGIKLEGTAALAELVKKRPSLTELNLADNSIEDEGAKILAGLLLQDQTNLKILNLNNNDLSDSSAALFADCITLNKNIQEIQLDNEKLTIAGEFKIKTAVEDSYPSSLSIIALKTSLFLGEISIVLKKNRERSDRAKQLDKINAWIKSQLQPGCTVFDLGWFNLKTFIFNLNFPETLNIIFLDNCNLTSVPAEIHKCVNLNTLDLHGNHISTLPPTFFQMPNLTHLDLSNNALYSIDPLIGSMSNLKILNLGYNFLTTVPTEMSRLQDLNILYLHCNQISVLPAEILQLSAISELRLEANPLAEVLQKIYKAWAKKAAELDLRNLGLKYLPADIRILDSLTSLDLSENMLVSLPPQIGKLTKLVSLDISHNQLEDLPYQMENLIQLEKLNFVGNRKLSIPEEPSLMRTLLSTQKDKLAGPFRRVKLMLVGKENVGKTSLKQCLLKAKNAKKIPNISTDGVAIEGWIPEEDEKARSKIPISFNIWDFGGQEVYYVTHQFFINPRAVYVVVFNLKERGDELTRVDYWLQLIRSQTENSPVFLVGTHADEISDRQVEEIQEQFRNRYAVTFPNIVAVLGLSCKTRKGVTALQELIMKTAIAQPYVDTSYSSGYHQLERLVISQRELMSPPVVSFNQFRNWCDDCHVTGPGEAGKAAQLLSDLGVIVFFNDPNLKDLVILDPQWLTRVMATLITTKPNFIKNGMLAESNLGQIWKAPDFPESLHPLLLNLFKKFEVTHSVPVNEGEERRYMFPSLVQSEAPVELTHKIRQLSVGSVCRSFIFDFLPLGFFSRLIVRLSHMLTISNYYHNLAILRHKEHNTFCILEFFTNHENFLELEVEVSVKFPTQVFRLIIEDIGVLLRGWYKVPHYVRVQCRCQRCQKSERSKRTFFTFRDCENSAARGEKNLICTGPQNDLPPNEISLEILASDLAMSDLKESIIEYENLKLENKIGMGAFGAVYRAEYRGQIVAVKKLAESLIFEEMVDVFAAFRREVWLSSIVKHTTIVNLLGYSVRPYCMIMEYIPGGNLKEYLYGSEPITIQLRLRIGLDIADAMVYLHSRNPKIIHRDLKSPNVLMVSRDEHALVTCKVTDFGESISAATKASGRDKLANPTWCAPEVMAGLTYTESADIFSLGIILWELVARARPYDEYPVSKSHFVATFEDAIVKQGLRPTIPKDCPPMLSELIQKCWRADPDERPTASEVHRCMKDIVRMNQLERRSSGGRRGSGNAVIISRKLSAPVMAAPKLSSIAKSPPPSTSSPPTGSSPGRRMMSFVTVDRPKSPSSK
eukprot:TRINITY_DN3370_c0_g1_i1.p1 TRINITY_DN3370_c0_g1~~TRINITY_DN3370_c0_g1_i1.p1  ORF type:complete len:2124 (-),score=675.67 TRINITY_DN3370_c0_g1_i1:56-5518(-)